MPKITGPRQRGLSGAQEHHLTMKLAEAPCQPLPPRSSGLQLCHDPVTQCKASLLLPGNHFVPRQHQLCLKGKEGCGGPGEGTDVTQKGHCPHCAHTSRSSEDESCKAGSELEAPKIARVRPVARDGQLTSCHKHPGEPSCLCRTCSASLSGTLPSVGLAGTGLGHPHADSPEGPPEPGGTLLPALPCPH